MNPTTKTSTELLHELFEWCQTARNLYASASQSHDSPGLRALKLYLAERHTEHLRDLRQALHELGGGGSLGAQRHQPQTLGLGFETQRALVSTNRAMVLLACSQVEKQIALAYDEVWRDPVLTEARARAVVNRHIAELDSSQAFVHQIETEQGQGPQASRPTLAAS